MILWHLEAPEITVQKQELQSRTKTYHGVVKHVYVAMKYQGHTNSKATSRPDQHIVKAVQSVGGTCNFPQKDMNLVKK